MTMGSTPPLHATHVPSPMDPIAVLRGAWPVWAGIALLAVPVLVDLAHGPWAGDLGSYGMIVLALAIWLVARRWPEMKAAGAPGHAAIGVPLLLGALGMFVLARIVTHVVAETLAFYLALIATLYLFVGYRGLRQGWFPLFYGLLAVPPPRSLVLDLTMNLRLGITDAAVAVLDAAGYRVASSGNMMFVDQYQIAIVEACSGINSMISLTAIGLFYVYFRRPSLSLPAWIAAWLTIIAFAVLGNFVRVLAIILMTHYFGSGVAQGPAHEATGLLTFVVTLGGVMLLDAILPESRASRETPHG